MEKEELQDKRSHEDARLVPSVLQGAGPSTCWRRAVDGVWPVLTIGAPTAMAVLGHVTRALSGAGRVQSRVRRLWACTLQTPGGRGD